MTSQSLARRVLTLADEIDQQVTELTSEGFPVTAATVRALTLATDNLREAAEIRLRASASEKTRRQSSSAGPVMSGGK